MHMLLKGDYFNGRFTHPDGLANLAGAQERILKTCPGETTLNLWEAGSFYDHVEPVIESAQKGFDVWRKLSFADRVVYLKKYQEIVRARKDEIALALALEVGNHSGKLKLRLRPWTVKLL